MGTIYPNMVVGNKDDMAKQGQKMVGSGGETLWENNQAFIGYRVTTTYFWAI